MAAREPTGDYDANGIQIDSERPFALVLPVNVGNVTIYDTNGTTVKTMVCRL